MVLLPRRLTNTSLLTSRICILEIKIWRSLSNAAILELSGKANLPGRYDFGLLLQNRILLFSYVIEAKMLYFQVLHFLADRWVDFDAIDFQCLMIW